MHASVLSKMEARAIIERKLVKRIPANVTQLRELTSSGDFVRARHQHEQFTGTIRLIEGERGETLRAEYDYGIDALLSESKSSKFSTQVYVVAGAGFSTFRVKLELR